MNSGRCCRTALYEVKGPAALRYPRGAEPASLAGWQGDGGAYDMVGGPENRMLVVTYGENLRRRSGSFAAAGWHFGSQAQPASSSPGGGGAGGIRL